MRCALSTLLFLVFATTTPLPALDEPVPPTTHEIEQLNNQGPLVEGERGDHFFAELMNMLSTLGIILLALLIVAWITRRMLNTRLEQVNTTSSIKILERRSLAPRVTIYVLDISGARLIVGETPAGLVRLGELASEGSPFARMLQEKKLGGAEEPRG